MNNAEVQMVKKLPQDALRRLVRSEGKIIEGSTLTGIFTCMGAGYVHAINDGSLPATTIEYVLGGATVGLFATACVAWKRHAQILQILYHKNTMSKPLDPS